VFFEDLNAERYAIMKVLTVSFPLLRLYQGAAVSKPPITNRRRSGDRRSLIRDSPGQLVFVKNMRSLSVNQSFK
jgi:hypothetical protein